MVQMAFCDWSHKFHKQVTNVSQHVFVILLWEILMSPLSILNLPYLWRTANVPALTRCTPSSTARLPSRAAVTSGDGRHAVSPLVSVVRCWRRSRDVMSCGKTKGLNEISMGDYDIVCFPPIHPMLGAQAFGEM